MPEVILTNVAFEPVATLSWKRAATMIVRGSAFNLDGSQVIKTIFSPSMTLNIHRVIHTKEYIYIPNRNLTLDSYANRRTILVRDNYKCAYCGRFGNTIDHINPRCNGGQSTFGNQVAACNDCNNKKADKTPYGAGMSLKFTPYVYDPYEGTKKELEDIFALALK